jgi:hypothetical protein
VGGFLRALAGRLATWPSQRFAAAFLAISARRSGDSFLSRARTIAIAAGFFFFATTRQI